MTAFLIDNAGPDSFTRQTEWNKNGAFIG